MYKKYIIFLIITLFSIKNSFSIENKIIVKVDNEIITSLDVFNESRYLIAFNKNLQKVNKQDIYKISLNSLIKEKIREIELLKNMEKLEIDENYLNQLIVSTYERMKFQNQNDFENYLKGFELDLTSVKSKIRIEALWNELIYAKFSNKIIIDEKKIRNRIIQQKQKKIRSFKLSEIVFNKKENLSINQTYDKIKNDILNNGFENAALMHSISNSSTNGGDLGWVNEDTINKKLIIELNKINIGEYTNPITIPGGLLILKLNNINEIERNIDIEKGVKELIKIQTSQQLDQFSNVYFNKIKNEIQINEQ